MPLEAKICGLKKKEDIILSINKGASYCGFIVNYPKSHRNIKSKSSLAKLNSINKKNSKFVAVLVNPTNKDLIKIKGIKFDFIQLHGNEDNNYIGLLKKEFDIKVIKSIGIKEKVDFKKMEKLSNVDYYLFDYKPKITELPGGNAKKFKWSLLENIRINKPSLENQNINFGDMLIDKDELNLLIKDLI